jgi:prolyl 4-hydroxylase
MSEAWPDDADLPSIARAEIGERVRQRLSRNPMISRIQTDKAEMFLRHGLMSPQECAQMMALVDEEAIPSKLFSSGENPGYRTSSSGNMRMDNPLVQQA